MVWGGGAKGPITGERRQKTRLGKGVNGGDQALDKDRRLLRYDKYRKDWLISDFPFF